MREKILFWAKASDIDADLIGAIVQVESAGNEKAMRYEKHWRYLVHPEKFAKLNNVSRETEEELQKFSYGLMQVMGSVAREHGMRGPLVNLLDPDLGLQYGCVHLKSFMQRYAKLSDAVSSYNQGSPRKTEDGIKYLNQAYVDKVKALYDRRLITIGK
jgi:soluble lytic murein transglycosylase-like protein